MISELAVTLPTKGRKSYAYMPEEIKIKVKDIAEYLLEQPDLKRHLDKNLEMVCTGAKLYTGKEENLEEVRNRAYEDILKRVLQLILQTAFESRKVNTHIVDKKLADKTADFIKNMEHKISNEIEIKEVLKKTINVLYQANKENEEIVKIIQNTLEKNKIKFEVELKEFVDNTIKELKENPIIQYRMTTKDIKSFIETLKFSGFTEVEAFKTLKDINDNIIEKAEEQFEKLVAKGILEKTKNAYVLTSEAKKEFSITKKFTSEEQTIINAIKYGVKKDDIKRNLTLNELLERKNIVTVFKEHYSDEFKIKKFDIRLKKFAEKYDYIIDTRNLRISIL